MKQVSNYKLKNRLVEDKSVISIKYVEICNTVAEDVGVKLQVVESNARGRSGLMVAN